MDDTTQSVSDQFTSLLGDENQSDENAEAQAETGAADEQAESNDEAPAENAEQDESQGAQEEEDSVELSTIAGYLGLDTNDLDVNAENVVTLRTKVDGEEKFVPLSEIKTSHQLRGHLDNTIRKATEDGRILSERLAQFDNETSTRIQALDDNLQVYTALHESQLNSPEMARLQQEDTTEYLVQKDKLTQFKVFLDSQKGILEEARTKQQKDRNQQTALYYQQEQAKLPILIPEWGNNQTAQKEKREVSSYLLNIGYDESTVSRLSALDISLARKAMLHDGANPEQKKVTKQVKIGKPGATGNKTKAKASDKKIKSLEADARSGKRGAVAQLFEATGKM